MVLCQIYTTTALNNLLSVGISGRKKVRIVRIDYTGTANASIQLQSNILRVPYGNVPWFTFSSNPNHQIGNIHNEIEFVDVNLNGNLDVSVVDATTGNAPAGFTALMMLLDITDYSN
jgi:hypothetical protein